MAQKLAKVNIEVKGLKYRLTKQELSSLESEIDENGNHPCSFQPEPDNEVDPKAVKVISQDSGSLFYNRHIGYVGRPVNKVLFKLLKKNVEIKKCELTFVDAAEGAAMLELVIVRKTEKSAK